MATDMTTDVFANTTYGKIAIDKLGDVSDNFRLYVVAWLDNSRDVMEVTGAEFRKAKSGKNKGVLSILVKGTDRKVFVTAKEMEAVTPNFI